MLILKCTVELQKTQKPINKYKMYHLLSLIKKREKNVKYIWLRVILQHYIVYIYINKERERKREGERKK